MPSSSNKRAHGLALLGLSLLVGLGPALDALAFTRFEALPHSKVRAGEFVRAALPRGAPIAVALHPAQWAGQAFITPVDDVAQHDAAWYRAQGYRYLIANAKETDQARYRQLRDEARVLAEFPGDQAGQPGPPMAALDLGEHPEALAIEPRPAAFGGRLALLGFQRGAGTLRSAFAPLGSERAARPGQALLINLYWRALEPMEEDYMLFVHVIDAQGQIAAQRDVAIRAADYPTSRWRMGELVLDMADTPLPTTLAPGDYQVEIGVYSSADFARLPLDTHADGALPLMSLRIQ